ncbi:MAG TPA: hypothetical protein VK607_18635 [Kofleriaceae bacterium]|nr:hypothetical protein [Kofleriaceae bacterium]
MGPPPRSLPLVALALGVAVLVVQIRVIAGGQTWADLRYHTEVAPPRLAAAAAVQRGELPAWWDGSGLGVALAGEPAHGALYPPGWLAAAPRALDLTAVAHLAWAALGVAVWARRRASDRAALVAGVLAATTGVLASAALRGALPAIAHLPWLAVAAASLARAATPRSRALAACAIGGLVGAIALVGELAVAVDAIAIALALGLTRTSARWLAAGLAAGLAIGAAQWIPAVLQLPRGAGAEVAGLPLARLIELLVPGAFGGTGPEHAIPAIAGTAPWAPSLFVGAPLLALAAVCAPPRRVLGAIAGLAAAALVAGRGGWPAWLGAPELHLAGLVVVLAAASADGLDALALGRRRAVLALGFAAGLSALALAALGVLGAQHRELAPAIDRALLDGGLGLACIAGAAVLAWRAPARRFAVLCGLLVAPGVGAAHSVAPVTDRAVVTEPPAWARLVEHRPPPVRVYRPVFPTERPELDDAIATLAGGSAWRWGLAAARSEDPARAQVHDRAWLAAAHEGGALLDRYGIGLAILPATVVSGRGMRALGRRGSWALVELPVAPAAAVMYGWRWAIDPGDALALLFPAGGGTGVLRGTTVLGGGGPPGPSAIEPQPCAIDAWRDGDIAVTCVADRPGYAAVASAAAPGWTVTVDDRAADWLASDVLRRAVAIPAGSHRVHWRYAAPGLGAGGLVALAGVLGLAAIWLAGRRARVDASGELTH